MTSVEFHEISFVISPSRHSKLQKYEKKIFHFKGALSISWLFNLIYVDIGSSKTI